MLTATPSSAGAVAGDEMSEMLLRNLPVQALADALASNSNLSPAPHLLGRSGVRARATAKKCGVWDKVSALCAEEPIPVLRRSVYQQWTRLGSRSKSDEFMRLRRERLNLAAMALWLEHPRANVDHLQDLIWAFCDDFTWVGVSHQRCEVDLFAAGLAANLAEILHVLGGKLEPEVVDRAWREIDRRILQQYSGSGNWWRTCHNNWNHVCNGCIARIILLRGGDAARHAHMLHTCLQNMTYALDGFADDGGCAEGPGYWGYGFGNYLLAAHALFRRTGGTVNIAADEKIARICRYPLVAYACGSSRATFSDCGAGNAFLPAETALLVNEFHRAPELYEYCALNRDRSLKLSTMQSLGLYKGQKATGRADRRDYLLGQLGMVRMCGGRDTVVFAQAGNNGVSHNHNDVGSFILTRGGVHWLTDPGGPKYNSQTFGPRRYEIAFCNSLGHSVPLINGTQQRAGAEHCGTLQAHNLNSSAPRKAVIDMTRAYPRGTVRSLVRTLTLDGRRLTVEDAYQFARKPRALEEAFVTLQRARVLPGGKGVRIGPVKGGVRIAVACPGRWSVGEIAGSAADSHLGKPIVRIVFRPARLVREMTLSFEID
jgi:hypothetical protein